MTAKSRKLNNNAQKAKQFTAFMSTVCPCTVLARVIQDQQGTTRREVVSIYEVIHNLEFGRFDKIHFARWMFTHKLCYSDCLYV